MGRRVLVADDDPHIREVICFALHGAGMETVSVADGEAALTSFCQTTPDLVVLDVGMPSVDGLEVCRRIRQSSDVPILFLSARDEEIDRVLGLEMGGDDYVTKPFSPRELVARVNGILRRGRAPAAKELVIHGSLNLDVPGRQARYGDQPVALTAVEFAILRCLAARLLHVLTRNQLVDASHGANIHLSGRTIDSHIRNIRAKFAAAGCDDVIQTVHGIGFRLGRCGA